MYLKKSLGQHLLIAHPTVEKIARTLAPTRDDTVLEIGPGTGILTKELLKLAGHVVAVEKDPDMVSALRSLESGSGNLELIHSDFLELDLVSLFSGSRFTVHGSRFFCGNLPYNISTPILFKLRDHKELFERGVIMIQKEVAERLVAKPGGKDYGILSIMMQTDAKIEKCFNVSPRSFLPPPKVTSTVVNIHFYKDPPYKIKNRQLFENIVKSCFGKRRKMIRNSIPKEHLLALEKAGIKPTQRPEELSIEKYVLLANTIIS